MQDFDKLGLFYLGREYDLEREQRRERLVLYDSRDLTTHAVCVGMTGSGKTGLCLGVIEEAALDHVPVLAIDPKGDLPNLLLTFPDLAPADFEPWVSAEDAARAGVTVAALAAREAEKWRRGLTESGQDDARIGRLKDSARVTIYTPGSRAGTPLSLLASLAPPSEAIRNDQELFAERVSTVAGSILTLADADADARSRERALLSALLTHAWQAGTSLNLAALVRQIQTPPFSRLGVLDVDAFFPPRDRFELASRLNTLLATPGFDAWLEGEPLDAGRLLYDGQGRPRVAIVSIAHLNDAERMFVVSMLLGETVAWMRVQPGTASLRAVLYFDEVLGYLPPVANPPSKPPLLTLLKQGRAFGLGVIVATQNPVDLDYKGLSNAGTWFIGRLQTERDKARVLDGLEGVAGARAGFDRATIDRTIGALPSRVFLMHNVHEDAPVVFETRWTLSYLRGPMQREEIRRGTGQAAVVAAPAAEGTVKSTQATGRGDETTAPPVLPPGIAQYFAPVTRDAAQPVRYAPRLYGAARVTFTDAKRGIDVTADRAFVTPIEDAAVAVNWDHAAPARFSPAELTKEPSGAATYAPLPAAAAKTGSYPTWSKQFATWLQRAQRLELRRSARHKASSKPGESERDFRIRLQDTLREARDAEADRIRQKYAPKLLALQERIRKAEAAVGREASQVSEQKLQTAVSVGATVLDALLGRKRVRVSTLGRATTAARGVSRTMKQQEDVKRAEANVAALNTQLEELNARLEAELQALTTSNAAAEPLEIVAVKAKRGGIEVVLVALVWMVQAGSGPGLE
jgi:hypothetical protein